MRSIDVLKNEYLGDALWGQFVAIFRPAWNNWPDKNMYITKLVYEDIAIVLTAEMGQGALLWFDTPVIALEQQSPRQILNLESNGLIILRSMIMRMPR